MGGVLTFLIVLVVVAAPFVVIGMIARSKRSNRRDPRYRTQRGDSHQRHSGGSEPYWVAGAAGIDAGSSSSCSGGWYPESGGGHHQHGGGHHDSGGSGSSCGGGSSSSCSGGSSSSCSGGSSSSCGGGSS
ncbi:hypothetical protein DMB37_30750 [Nocardia sp. CS682]|nr:hypothetical protein DMB37_30750 [Nocardia sp. CS682]